MTPTPFTDLPVATGDRVDETSFEPDADQLVRAVHLAPAIAPLPAQLTASDDNEAEAPNPGFTDVRVAPDSPSVWDARPLDD